MNLTEAKTILIENGYEVENPAEINLYTEDGIKQFAYNYVIKYYEQFPEDLSRDVKYYKETGHVRDAINWGQIDEYYNEYPLLMELLMEGDNIISNIADNVYVQYVKKFAEQ